MNVRLTISLLALLAGLALESAGQETITDINGNIYPVVSIGDQDWMAENLRVSRYRNGDSLHSGKPHTFWLHSEEGIWAWYDDNPDNDPLYGKLYNWYAAADPRGICPAGWRIPSDADWQQLADFADPDYWGNSNILGRVLKSRRQVNSPLGPPWDTSEHPRWNQHGKRFGTDDYGFAAIPGGGKAPGNAYVHLGQQAYFWSSSSLNEDVAWVRTILFSHRGMSRSGYHKNRGMSVRCIRGEEELPEITTPSLETLVVKEITAESAVGGGVVVDGGGATVTSRGVVWSRQQSPSLENHEGFTVDGSGTGSFTSQLTNLLPATTYYLRAYAENVAGVGYGGEVAFETSEITGFDLELASHPSGAGTLTGAGAYLPGEEVQITAIPEAGYNFLHWSYDGDTLSEWPEFTFTMPAEDVSLSANFIHDSIMSNDFWFAIPRVTEGHGWSSRSFGFYFVNGNHHNSVRISMPADLNFEPIELFLQPNETYKLDLTDQIQQFWAGSPGEVQNKGFYIESTQKVNAFFEIGTQNNPDIFTLKGEKALGTEFYVPFQNTFPNAVNYTPRPYSAIYIVATEDNTQVTITPSRPAYPGQPANIPFVIQLNKGQTYAVAPDAYAQQGQQPENRLAGTRVQSTKPVAVIMSDDSVAASGCRDLVGDQIVPVSQVGTEYIMMRGRLTLPEYFYVLATEDGQTTEVAIDGQPAFSLQAGQQAAFEFTGSLHHVVASHPVYVLHLAGFGCEVGGAIIPPLENQGQRQIDFTRTRGESFFLNLLVKSGAQDGFTLNGLPLPAASFVPVPGAPGWLAGEFEFSLDQIPVHQTSTIQNSKGTFHMSIISGGASSGAMYGNFSF